MCIGLVLSRLESVERVFNVPGIGQHIVSTAQAMVPFLIMGEALIFATMSVLLNLAVDVLYRWMNPRIT